MDIDAGFLPTEFPRSHNPFAAIRRTPTDNTQVSGSLMRYHSAPSAVLASLLDEDLLSYRDASPFNQVEESEFSRLLSDDLRLLSSLCDSRSLQEVDNPRAGLIMSGTKDQQHPSVPSGAIGEQSQYLGAGCASISEDNDEGALSASFEHEMEESLDQFCSPETPMAVNQHVTQLGHQRKTDCSSHNPSLLNFGRMPLAKSKLIRHSSSPADFLSSLVMEASSEMPHSHVPGSFAQATVNDMPGSESGEKISLSTTRLSGTVPNFSMGKCYRKVTSMGKSNDELLVGAGGLESPCVPSRSGLLRQSSSPAGLLSQLSLDGISIVGEKVSIPSSSWDSSEESIFEERGTNVVANYTLGGWDNDPTMQSVEPFGQRKRGRGIEAKHQGLLLTDSFQPSGADNITCQQNHYGIPATAISGIAVSIERSTVDAVLCKARAKRGCATHPRSIAERVRRTKISERMRKLQELVPNMDKQTNTADMLDEAVEYVKLLQRQVQELAVNRPKCNGTCEQKGNASFQV